MSFNLGGGYQFGGNAGGFVDLNHGGLMASRDKAILYVFEPKRGMIQDVAHRTLNYSFDDNFLVKIQEVSDMGRRGVATESRIMEDLQSQINLSDNMIPSIRPTWNIRTSLLSDNWMFICILTQNGGDAHIGNTLINTGENSNVRRIFTGFFTDEPFNPQTFSTARRTLNPNAVMVITHKTVIGASTAYTQMGPRSDLTSWGSEEVVHAGVLQNLIGDVGMNGRTHLNLITPDQCLQSVSSDDDGMIMTTPGHSNILQDKGATVIPDLFENTSRNVGVVVGGIVKYHDQQTSRAHVSGHGGMGYFEEQFLNEDFHRNSLARHMGVQRIKRNNPLDLDENSQISAQALSDLVNGDLDVVPIGINRPEFYETAEQSELSMTNQYSFLISTVIVAIMNSVGLNAISFDYQVRWNGGIKEDDWVPTSAELTYQTPDAANIIRQKAKAVEYEMKNSIFRTIFESKGAFHVSVNANATGMTQVALSLVDQGYRCPAPFVLPSLFGGIITPMIGDTIATTHNSEQIEGLYRIATGADQTPEMERPAFPYFDPNTPYTLD